MGISDHLAGESYKYRSKEPNWIKKESGADVMARKENLFGHICKIRDDCSLTIIMFRKMDRW